MRLNGFLRYFMAIGKQTMPTAEKRKFEPFTVLYYAHFRQCRDYSGASLPIGSRTQNEQIVKFAPNRVSIFSKVGTIFSDATVYLGGIKKVALKFLESRK